MVAAFPAQMFGELPVVAAGSGFTLTVTEPVLVHPLVVLVCVRVYTVVFVGFALGLEMVAELNPVAGDQR